MGEEMNVVPVWEAHKRAMGSLASLLPTQAETIACQVGNALECDYAEIDMPPAERNARDIPLDYSDDNSPYPAEQKRKWKKEREQYMVEQASKNVGNAQNVLIICGFKHAKNLSELFQQAGYEVKTRYVRDERWYKEISS